jgi:Inositol monophosphatase family
MFVDRHFRKLQLCFLVFVALFVCSVASFKAPLIRTTSRSLEVSKLSAMSKHADQDNLEATARNAVMAAGKIITEGSGTIDLSSDAKSKIGSRDIVTHCDINAQTIIKKMISDAYPTHKFLGEEDVAPGREAATKEINEKIDEEHLWIIDPIDGTTNFAHGQPLCGVILAYASEGGPITLFFILKLTAIKVCSVADERDYFHPTM